MSKKKLVGQAKKCLEIALMQDLKWRQTAVVVEIFGFHETSL